MFIRNQKLVSAHLLNYLLLVAITAAPCLARDSGHLYVTNEPLNTIDVIPASDHVRIASIPTIITPFGMALTHDGKRLYVSSYGSKTLSTFDTETNALISTLKFGSELREVALTPDERSSIFPTTARMWCTSWYGAFTSCLHVFGPDYVSQGAGVKDAFEEQEPGRKASCLAS
jgi:YVTN family beta-propeller protein